MLKKHDVLKRRALRLKQTGGCAVYLLSLSAADLLAVTALSPDENQSPADLLAAHQPTVRAHVANIQSGLKDHDALMLTPIVLGLCSEVRFRGSRGPDVSDGLASAGTLEIPLRTRNGRKPAWILDGYYRLLALSDRQEFDFAFPVSALVVDDSDVLRQQFDRIHRTHPLPADLGDALFPRRSLPISLTIGAQELPEAVCNWLNSDPESPFHELVGTAKDGTATPFLALRAALSKSIAESLSSPYGALFPYRNIAAGQTDIDGLCHAVKTYWSAVKSVFPEAWGKPPKRSRLMHPVGIRTMGRLMNRILPAVNLVAEDCLEQAVGELKKIKPVCHWASGVWEDLNALRWDRLENTTRHVNLLSNYLMREYLAK